jgi:hypothetical protein
MADLPATDLRKNVLTLAVPNDALPRIGCLMRSLLPAEEYDPTFAGQQLATTYLDTATLALRKARLKKKRYCTVRVRRYRADCYALSVKTEDGKYRVEIDPDVAEDIIRNGTDPELGQLPGDLLARLLELTDGEVLMPVAMVWLTRFAVEDATDRLTLDVSICSNTGKDFPTNILENKTLAVPAKPIARLTTLGLAPVKLSKFLWATTYGVR